MDHTFKKKHTKPFPKEKTNMSHPSPTTTVLDPFSPIPVLLGLKLQILGLKFTGLGVISSINHISMCAASPCSWSISSGPQDCGVFFQNHKLIHMLDALLRPPDALLLLLELGLSRRFNPEIPWTFYCKVYCIHRYLQLFQKNWRGSWTTEAWLRRSTSIPLPLQLRILMQIQLKHN